MGNLIISPQKASLPQISLIFYMGSFPISDLCVLGFLFFQVRYTDLWLVLVRWEAKLPKLQSKTRRRSPVVAPTSACNTIADSSQPVYIYIYIYIYISLSISLFCVFCLLLASGFCDNMVLVQGFEMGFDEFVILIGPIVFSFVFL